MLFSYNADLLPRLRMTGHIRYSQPWIHFARRLDEYVLYVIREGNMYLRENGLEYNLKAGDFFLLEPGLQHVGTRKASCDYFYTHFTHPELRRVEDGAAAMAELAEKRRQSLISYNLDAADPTDSVTYLPKHFHLSGGEHRSLLRSAVACYEAREEHYKRRASTFLHSFLLQTAHEHLMAEMAVLDRRLNRSEAAVDQLVQYLNRNYTKKLTSGEISERFEMNFDYLNRVFSAMTGSSIFSYINILRINNAKQLIASTDLAFSEIAYLVGIRDRYYFSRLFKKLTGMSPTEYYKKARGQ